ncbi:MAG: AAA family ATPase [Candidatus Binatia bacterium]
MAIAGKWVPPKPGLILIMGVAGSGKSTLSREILRCIWAVYLDNNHIADAFFPDTRNGPEYARLRPGFYRALYTITEENLKLGTSVLLDVPHVKEVQTPEWRGFIKRLAIRTKAKMVAIRCLCSDKVLHARIRSRGAQRDRWKLENWKEFLEKESVKVSIPFPHLDIDTERDLSSNIHAAVQYIRTQLGRPSN